MESELNQNQEQLYSRRQFLSAMKDTLIFLGLASPLGFVLDSHAQGAEHKATPEPLDEIKIGDSLVLEAKVLGITNGIYQIDASNAFLSYDGDKDYQGAISLDNVVILATDIKKTEFKPKSVVLTLKNFNSVISGRLVSIEKGDYKIEDIVVQAKPEIKSVGYVYGPFNMLVALTVKYDGGQEETLYVMQDPTEDSVVDEKRRVVWEQKYLPDGTPMLPSGSILISNKGQAYDVDTGRYLNFPYNPQTGQFGNFPGNQQFVGRVEPLSYFFSVNPGRYKMANISGNLIGGIDFEEGVLDIMTLRSGLVLNGYVDLVVPQVQRIQIKSVSIKAGRYKVNFGQSVIINSNVTKVEVKTK